MPAFKLTILFLLLICLAFDLAFNSPYMEYAKKLDNTRMPSPIVKSIVGSSIILCGMYCCSFPNCSGFNYGKMWLSGSGQVCIRTLHKYILTGLKLNLVKL